MDGACSMHVGDRFLQDFGWYDRGRNHLKDLDVDGRMLNGFREIRFMAVNGVIWLMIAVVGGLL
jgi:hypothetical protein